MGNTINKKLIIIIFLLCVTSGLAHIRRDTDLTVEDRQPLRFFFASLDGYAFSGHLTVERSIVDFLDLDDYIFLSFLKDNIPITLYIGYYFTGEKITSAHSPLVCFPAQGWMLDTMKVSYVSVGSQTVHYGEMEASLGQSRQLILYWFQTNRHTTPHSYTEKIYALYNRLIHNKNDNAFVRISIPLENISREKAIFIAEEFIRAFYPRFIQYIEKY